MEYKRITQENFWIAYQIQKVIWPEEPDLQNFIDKSQSIVDDNVSFLVFIDDKVIGITGIYTEDIDDESIWLDWYGVLPEFRGKGYGEKILLDTIEYCRKLKKYNYLRLDTTYLEGRPAINLYDKIMTFKEKYTIEDNDIPNNWLIYTYSFNGDKKLWNNKYLGLSEYYENCK